MTVENWLRADFPRFPIKEELLEKAALSPRKAKPIKLRALSLNDNVEDYDDDEEYDKSLDYAISTICYAIAGAFSGGSMSEQVGDVRAEESGFIITQADREYYRKKGDLLRQAIGCEIPQVVQEQGGVFDASNLRKPNKRGRWHL